MQHQHILFTTYHMYDIDEARISSLHNHRVTKHPDEPIHRDMTSLSQSGMCELTCGAQTQRLGLHRSSAT